MLQFFREKWKGWLHILLAFIEGFFTCEHFLLSCGGWFFFFFSFSSCASLYDGVVEPSASDVLIFQNFSTNVAFWLSNRLFSRAIPVKLLNFGLVCVADSLEITCLRNAYTRKCTWVFSECGSLIHSVGSELFNCLDARRLNCEYD